jgi:hypothetical protein
VTFTEVLMIDHSLTHLILLYVPSKSTYLITSEEAQCSGTLLLRLLGLTQLVCPLEFLILSRFMCTEVE